MRKCRKNLSGKTNNFVTCWLIEGRWDRNFGELKFRLTDNYKNAGSMAWVNLLWGLFYGSIYCYQNEFMVNLQPGAFGDCVIVQKFYCESGVFNNKVMILLNNVAEDDLKDLVCDRT